MRSSTALHRLISAFGSCWKDWIQNNAKLGYSRAELFIQLDKPALQLKSGHLRYQCFGLMATYGGQFYAYYCTEKMGQLFVFSLHNDFGTRDDCNHASSPARAKCTVRTMILTGWNFRRGTGLPALKDAWRYQFFIIFLYPEKHVCKNHYSFAEAIRHTQAFHALWADIIKDAPVIFINDFKQFLFIMGQITPDFFQIHALCKVSLWIKTYLQMSDWFFFSAGSSLLSVLLHIRFFLKKSVMRVILVLVNCSFWLISEGDRQWLSAGIMWWEPCTLSDLFHTPPEIQIYYPASFYLQNTELHQQMLLKGICGVFCFWCLIIFLMCLCYSFHYSPYYWNTLSGTSAHQSSGKHRLSTTIYSCLISV